MKASQDQELAFSACTLPRSWSLTHFRVAPAKSPEKGSKEERGEESCLVAKASHDLHFCVSGEPLTMCSFKCPSVHL